MRHWMEGVLAAAIVLGLGLGLFLYRGEPLPSDGSEGTSPPVTFDQEAAARGAVLAEGTACLQCHTIDGSSATGPTWKGLAGSDRPLTTGEFVRADDSYLFNSIVDPSSQVVEGFDDVMPSSFAGQLAEAEIDDLIAYIKSLAS
jgi:mono/diheme cytochrome c family protein